MRRPKKIPTTSKPKSYSLLGPKRILLAFLLIPILCYWFFRYDGIVNGFLAATVPHFQAIEALPDQYDPLEGPSYLARAWFYRDLAAYTDDERQQAKREPGVVDYLVRRNQEMGEDLNPDQLEILPRRQSDTSIPHLVQWDEAWGFHPYAGGQMGTTGCGPTVLAMVYYGLTGRLDYPPNRMADYASQHGYAVNEVGTAWALFDQGTLDLGLSSRGLGLDQDAWLDALRANQVLVLAMGPGDFTRDGHFIVVYAQQDGAFKILDPFNVQLSKRKWTFDDLAHQVQAVWAIGLME